MLIKEIFSFSIWGHAPNTDDDRGYLFISDNEEIHNELINVASKYSEIKTIDLSDLPTLTPWENYESQNN